MIKRFNRFELKYIATAAQCAGLKSDLLHHMRPDANGQDGSYAVTSLYYDTADFAFMRSKHEGIKFRRKLRVRRYGAQVDASLFVEIKQRINRTTQKRRLALPAAAAYALCAGHLDRELTDPADTTAAEEVLFLTRGLALEPACVVGYQRDALVGGDYEPGLRVTFDYDLWTAQADFELAADATHHALMPPDFRILEVKANNAVPLWLANMLARHHCALRRYSKYCAGIERLAQLERLAAPNLST